MTTITKATIQAWRGAGQNREAILTAVFTRDEDGQYHAWCPALHIGAKAADLTAPRDTIRRNCEFRLHAVSTPDTDWDGNDIAAMRPQQRSPLPILEPGQGSSPPFRERLAVHPYMLRVFAVLMDTTYHGDYLALRRLLDAIHPEFPPVYPSSKPQITAIFRRIEHHWWAYSPEMDLWSTHNTLEALRETLRISAERFLTGQMPNPIYDVPCLLPVLEPGAGSGTLFRERLNLPPVCMAPTPGNTEHLEHFLTWRPMEQYVHPHGNRGLKNWANHRKYYYEEPTRYYDDPIAEFTVHKDGSVTVQALEFVKLRLTAPSPAKAREAIQQAMQATLLELHHGRTFWLSELRRVPCGEHFYLPGRGKGDHFFEEVALGPFTATYHQYPLLKEDQENDVKFIDWPEEKKKAYFASHKGILALIHQSTAEEVAALLIKRMGLKENQAELTALIVKRLVLDADLMT
jgi:hypothetical protein